MEEIAMLEELIAKVASFRATTPAGGESAWSEYNTAYEQYVHRAGTEFEEVSDQTFRRVAVDMFMGGLIFEHGEELPALRTDYPTGFFDVLSIFSDQTIVNTIINTGVGTFAAGWTPGALGENGLPMFYEHSRLPSWAQGLRQAYQRELSAIEAINNFCRRRYVPWMEPLLNYRVGRVREAYAEDLTPIREDVFNRRRWREMIEQWQITVDVPEVLQDGNVR